MNKVLGIRILEITSLSIIFAVLFFFPGVYGQERDWDKVPWARQDYFAKDRDPKISELLHTVEQYHLSNANFWKKFNTPGQLEYALGDLQYVLGVFPNHPKALQLLGSVARLTKNLSLPLLFYQKALNLYPQYALTHAQYGAYLVDIGNIKAGITKLEEAIRMDPKLPQAHAWLAKAYYQSGNPELARQAAEQARKLGYKGKTSEGKWQ